MPYTIKHFISGIDLASGGPSRSMPSMCLGLKDIGVDCEVYAHKSKNPNDKILREAGIPVHLVKHAKYILEQIVSQNLIEGVDMTNCVAHIQNIWDPALHQVAKECRKKGTPYVISPRGMLEPWSLKQKRIKKRIGLAFYQLEDLKKASCIHATAESEMEHVRALGIECPIAVIPNGIKTDDYAEKDYDAPHTGKKRMLFLSRIHPKKGIDLLLKAWNILPEHLTAQWELVIAGEGGGDYTLDDLNALIARDFPHIDVIVAGPQYGEAKTKMYQSADVFVLPTYSENFGMVIAEAMCCGVPVITTTGTPWTELKEKKLGWYIDISVENLKEAMLDAMTRPNDELHEMGRRSREHILKEYSVEAVATKYKTLYGWLMGENTKPDFVFLNHEAQGQEVNGRKEPEEIRVLQTIAGLSTKSGGPSTCTHDLLESLSTISSPEGKECVVDLLTVENPSNLGKGKSWIKEVENDYTKPLYYSKNARDFMRESDYDLYHCNALWMGINHDTCKIAREKNKPYIISPHGMLYPTALKVHAWKKFILLNRWYKKDIYNATCIHATCEEEAEHVRAFGYKGPIAVIPNPVVIPKFAQLTKAKPLINGRKQIGFLGRLHPIKKIENVLYALGLLYEEERTKFSFQIMGKYDSKYELWLKDEVKRLHLEDCVEFVGFVSGEDKYKRLQNLWALMVPSVQENFGMIVPEALICGTPVYASLGTPWSELNGGLSPYPLLKEREIEASSQDTTQTRFLQNEDLGRLQSGWWRDNSPETIAEVLREIISMDENTCLEMGRNGRKLIEEKYEQKKVAEMMQELYTWIIEGGKKPGFVYE